MMEGLEAMMVVTMEVAAEGIKSYCDKIKEKDEKTRD